jgi:hypothetical protein
MCSSLIAVAVVGSVHEERWIDFDSHFDASTHTELWPTFWFDIKVN